MTHSNVMRDVFRQPACRNNPSKQNSALAVEERSVLDFYFHTRYRVVVQTYAHRVSHILGILTFSIP